MTTNTAHHMTTNTPHHMITNTARMITDTIHMTTNGTPPTTIHGGQQPSMKPNGPPSMILSGILHGIQQQSMIPNGKPAPTVHGGQQPSTKPNGQPIMSQPLSIRPIGLHIGELAPNGNQQHGGQPSGRQQLGVHNTHNHMDGIGMGMDGIKPIQVHQHINTPVPLCV
jgi:hypothetical protein